MNAFSLSYENEVVIKLLPARLPGILIQCWKSFKIIYKKKYWSASLIYQTH